jgi:hypothetical protein
MRNVRPALQARSCSDGTVLSPVHLDGRRRCTWSLNGVIHPENAWNVERRTPNAQLPPPPFGRHQSSGTRISELHVPFHSPVPARLALP